MKNPPIPKGYLELLKPFIAFKSISTDPAYKDQCEKTAQWLGGVFQKSGFTVQYLQGPTTNPVVLAHYIVDPKLETILIYGHYDVQPAERADGWKSDPYEVIERAGRLIARGAIDNKGQVLVHIYTILELIKAKELKYNIKFMIEGNEETGNPDMHALVKKHKKELSCDHLMISDGETAKNKPTIEASLRGGGSMTVTYTTGKNNLHSGLFGGAVPNAIHELSKLLAKFYDKDNKVTVPGFYAGVDLIKADVVKGNKKLTTAQEAATLAGVRALLPEKGIDFFTQVGLRPTIQVTGIQSGYTGEGYANIVPASAFAKINVRTVASQDSTRVIEAIKKFILKHTPTYVDVRIDARDPYPAIKINTSSPVVTHVRALLKNAYGEDPVTKYVGGGIPIVGDFKEILGKDTLLVSLANEDCNMHGVDENFDIALLHRALAFSDMFFRM